MFSIGNRCGGFLKSAKLDNLAENFIGGGAVFIVSAILKAELCIGDRLSKYDFNSPLASFVISTVTIKFVPSILTDIPS